MDAAAIEQMNKVRLSLGMAPLPVPGKDSGPQFKAKDDDDAASDSGDDMSTLDKRQAAADRNWEKLEAERQDKLDRQRRKDAAKKARDVAQRYAKLEGKGLGDDDGGEELDTRSWLLQQKKRQKKIDKARKMAEELAAREMQAEYTSKDLAGVRVAHEVDDFDEAAGEQVLTLKDAEIGEDSEDDELENAELKAREKQEERDRLKKKRPDYDPTEEGEANKVLSKYDEEIDGKKQKRFTLDGSGSGVRRAEETRGAEGDVKSRGIKINLDMFKDDAPTSDYVDPATIKVKKPKKKKEKKSRQKAADDDDIFAPAAQAANSDAMAVDGVPANGVEGPSRKRAWEFDDDDLQAKLAEQRREALKKRKKTDAAELTRLMREEISVDDEPEDGGMIMDETSEFVANLKKPEVPDARKRSAEVETPALKEEEEGDDHDVDMANASYADIEERQERLKREESTPAPAETEMTATGLEDEDSMSGQGLGASLAMLRKRGLVDDTGAEALAEKERKRNKFLNDKKSLIDEYDAKAREQREADRHSGRWDKMSNRERDAYARQQNEAREMYLARLQADMFNKEYRPDVKLQYHDEYGRSMGQKEAFKHLSHMFHGKGSGKQKTEKRLKKIDDEKREMSKGVLHAGEEGGFSHVQGREGRRQKQAGVRLQ